MRVSDAIFKQLSQAYLKIRNTARYILGNLEGFDANNLTAAEDMLPLDRWAITRLNDLIERCIKGYEDYEYHIVYHAIYNFCVVDMSNFYLDVIKDRLYCEERDGAQRRSAQTAMFLILDAMVRLLGPILAFTSDEIWQAMPHRASDDAENVILNQMPKPYADYALDAETLAVWQKYVVLRDGVNLKLEEARAAKLIGKPLEAAVTLCCGDEVMVLLAGKEELLRTLFIVSDVMLVAGNGGEDCAELPGVSISVQAASGEKCERCWMYAHTVGTDAEHPTLCARCAGVVRA